MIKRILIYVVSPLSRKGTEYHCKRELSAARG